MTLILIAGLIFATVCAMLAGHYGRSRGAWAVAGFFGGIFTLLILAIIGRPKPPLPPRPRVEW